MIRCRSVNNVLITVPQLFGYTYYQVTAEFPGGTPIEKGRGWTSEISKRNPKGYQDPVFWVCLEVFHQF